MWCDKGLNSMRQEKKTRSFQKGCSSKSDGKSDREIELELGSECGFGRARDCVQINELSKHGMEIARTLKSKWIENT